MHRPCPRPVPCPGRPRAAAPRRGPAGRGLALACAASLLLACPGLQEGAARDGAPADQRAADQAAVDARPARDRDADGAVPSPDLGLAARLCQDPSLLMHLRFAGTTDDQDGTAATAYGQGLSFDLAAGQPAPALKRQVTEFGVRYPGTELSAVQGTVLVWIRPDYDPAAVKNEGRQFFAANFRDGGIPSGAFRLLHRAIDDTQERGVGIETFGKGATSDNFTRMLVPDSNLRQGSWTHVAATYRRDKGGLALYIDGAQQLSQKEKKPTASFFEGETWQVAAGGVVDDKMYSYAEGWSGEVDEVMTFSRVLTGREIRALYRDRCP